MKIEHGDSAINVKVQKSEARFRRAGDFNNSTIGHGEFFFLLDITALTVTIYLPISIASGKKPTGFLYQIEGTAEGTIFATDISCQGDGITKITIGTLLYAKIPAGRTATFRVYIETRGRTGKEYRVLINRINYKLDPSDARYQRFDTEIATKPVER